RVAGRALAGVLIAAAGPEAAYAVDAVTYTLGFLAALALRSLPPEAAVIDRGAKAVASGFGFFGQNGLLQSMFVVDLVAMIFGSPQALFPVIAVQQLHRGPEVVGLLFAAPAAGALLLTLVSGPLTTMRRQGKAVVWAVAAWGAAIAGFGLAGDVLPLALVFLALAGAADVVSAIFRSTILQVTVPDHLRGRLGAVFFIVVTGGPKLGDIEAGLVASAFTPTISVVSGGLACIAGAFLTGKLYPELPAYRT